MPQDDLIYQFAPKEGFQYCDRIEATVQDRIREVSCGDKRYEVHALFKCSLEFGVPTLERISFIIPN